MSLYGLPAQGVLEVSLPHLTDRAGVVGLIDATGRTIDACSYDKARLPRGMKTKAGVAWERVDPLRDDDGATNGVLHVLPKAMLPPVEPIRFGAKSRENKTPRPLMLLVGDLPPLRNFCRSYVHTQATKSPGVSMT